MSKRNRKNKEKQKAVSEYKMISFSKEQMIEMQAEAYYQAMKRLEDEKVKEAIETENQKVERWYHRLLVVILFMLCPWGLNKLYGLKRTIYDGVLLVPVVSIMQIAGTLFWGVGVIGIVGIGACLIPQYNGTIIFLESILSMMFGSLLIASAKQFSKETDSGKIYAYSASVFAMIGCVISVVALMN